MEEETLKKAVQLKDQGEFARARELLLKLHHAKPEAASILAVLADVCWDMNQLDEAASFLQMAIKLKPSSEALSSALFHCLFESGHEDEAFDELRRFMSCNSSEAYSQLLRDIQK